VRLAHLIQEQVLKDAQPYKIDAQNGVAADRDGVRPEVVFRDAQALSVLGTVDFDDQLQRIPSHVEVDLAPWPTPHDLSIRLGKPSVSTQTSEVKLAQGVRSIHKVGDDLADERPTTATLDARGRALETGGRNNALLNHDA
jgi:hypothetical protein